MLAITNDIDSGRQHERKPTNVLDCTQLTLQASGMSSRDYKRVVCEGYLCVWREGVFCVREWLSLRANDETPRLSHTTIMRTLRAQRVDSSRTTTKTRDAQQLILQTIATPNKSAPRNPRMTARPTLLWRNYTGCYYVSKTGGCPTLYKRTRLDCTDDGAYSQDSKQLAAYFQHLWDAERSVISLRWKAPWVTAWSTLLPSTKVHTNLKALNPFKYWKTPLYRYSDQALN